MCQLPCLDSFYSYLEIPALWERCIRGTSIKRMKKLFQIYFYTCCAQQAFWQDNFFDSMNIIFRYKIHSFCIDLINEKILSGIVCLKFSVLNQTSNAKCSTNHEIANSSLTRITTRFYNIITIRIGNRTIDPYSCVT